MLSAVKSLLRKNRFIFSSYHQARLAYEILPKKVAYRMAVALQPLARDVSEAAHTLRRDGIVILPSYLDARLVADMRRAMEGAFARGQYTYGKGKFAAESPPDNVGTLDRFAVLDPTLYSRAFIDFAVDEFLTSVVQEYLGMRIVLAGIAAYRTQATPGGPSGSFLWHYDNAPCQVKAICYLTPVLDEKRGPLGIVRGTHRRRTISSSYEETRLDPEETARDAEFCLGVAGTVLVVDTLAAHRATPVIEGHRDVVSIIYDGGTKDRKNVFYNLPIPTEFLKGLNPAQREILRAPPNPGQINDRPDNKRPASPQT